MRFHYCLKRLSEKERQVLEEVLCSEIETQQWFTVACIEMLAEEIFVMLQ